MPIAGLLLRSIFASFLLILSSPGYALGQQTVVEGRVNDAGGRPLPGVNVVVEGASIGTATDVSGRYRLALRDTTGIRLTASAVGYRRETRALPAGAGPVYQVDFVLEELTLQPGEVVVTASRREQAALSAPVSVSVLTPADVDASNLLTLDEALRYIPGVQMAGNQVNVRGSSGFSYNVGSRVLMLVDGSPVLGPDTGGIPFEALPLSQVERIEVVKGPGSALYGAGALGGVINVITRDFPRKPESELSAFIGAHDPVRYASWRDAWRGADRLRGLGGFQAAHARRVGDRLGFWADGAYRRDTGYMNFNRNETLQGFAKVGWKAGAGLRLDVFGGYTWREYDSFFYWNGTADPLNPGRLDLIKEGSRGANDLQSTLLSVLPVLTHAPGRNWFYTIRGRFYRGVYHPLDDEGNLRDRSQRTIGYRAGAEVQVNWNPKPGRHLVAGISGDGLAARSLFFAGTDGGLVRGQPEGAVFGQWEETLHPRLTLTGGARYDVYQIDETETAARLSPKLNASMRLHDRLFLRAAFGLGFRIPSVAERFTNNQDFFPVLPNLALKPEESTGYEVGLKGRLPVTGFGNLQADIAAFRNDYRRLVEPVFNLAGGSAGFRFENLTRARIRGIEATLDGQMWADRLRLRLGYTWLDARDQELDLPLVFRSRHLLKGSVSARLLPFLEAGIDGRYSSKPQRQDTDFARFVPDAGVAVPVRVVDARIGADVAIFNFSLLVRNAFDYYYVERPALLAPPREVQVLVRVLF